MKEHTHILFECSAIEASILSPDCAVSLKIVPFITTSVRTTNPTKIKQFKAKRRKFCDRQSVLVMADISILAGYVWNIYLGFSETI
jgi:hypothetical protein